MLALGSENGVVKIFNLKTQTVSKKWGVMSNEREIFQMCWGADDQSVFSGMANGTVDWTTIEGELLKTFSIDSPNQPITGLSLLQNNRLLVTGQNGAVRVFSTDSGEIVSKFRLKRTITDMKYSSSVSSGSQAKNIEAGNDGRFIVCGGKEKLAQLIDLELKKSIWQSVNVPPDQLRMAVPIYDKALDWIDRDHTFITATMHGHIRIYDVREHKRSPTIIMDTKKMHLPLSSISVSPSNSNHFCTGDQVGNFRYYDKRMSLLPIGKTKGMVGSIKSIAYHPTKEFVACVGLDRYLHIMNSNPSSSNHKNKSIVCKSYVKLKMNKVLFSDYEEPEAEQMEVEIVPEVKPAKAKAKKDEIDKILGALPVAIEPTKPTTTKVESTTSTTSLNKKKKRNSVEEEKIVEKSQKKSKHT
jgi:ribosome biogenesis protein NSA1